MGFVAKLALSHSERDRNAKFLSPVGASVGAENISLAPGERCLTLFCSHSDPRILYRYWKCLLILGTRRNSWKQSPFGLLALKQLSTPPRAPPAACAHRSVGRTGTPPRAEEGSVTGTAVHRFMGLTLNFSSSQTTFLMLLFKCCLSMCHSICSHRARWLWRRAWGASVTASALPSRGCGRAGGFRHLSLRPAPGAGARTSSCFVQHFVC